MSGIKKNNLQAATASLAKYILEYFIYLRLIGFYTMLSTTDLRVITIMTDYRKLGFFFCFGLSQRRVVRRQ